MSTEPISQALKETLPSEGRILVAVSGGLDSVVLLDALMQIRAEHGLQLEVAHVDHALRSESAADAQFVKLLAERFHVPFHATQLTPPSIGENIEVWGREERYKFFDKILSQRGLDLIATAHHANDAAETLLMRFLANREPSSIHALDAQRKIVRPLLRIGRAQLEDYAEQRGLTFREDASNSNQNFLRNRYRHTIIPFLESELKTDLTAALAVRAESLEDDAQALEHAARLALQPLEQFTLGTKEWFRELQAVLNQAPKAVAWRVVERVLASAYGSYFGRRTSLRVIDFINSGEIAIEVPGGRRISRRNGGLIF